MDYWALGVLIYEMLKGISPFYHQETMKIYERIVSGRYPSLKTSASDPARELIKRLLKVDLTQRFGILKDGINDIKGHPWFNDLDWNELFLRKLPAPFIPELNGEADAMHFERFSDEEISNGANVEYDNEFESF